MPAESTTAYRQVRRAYELGRLRASLWRGAGIAVPLALVAVGMAGRGVIVALPFTLAAWIFAQWRGDAFLRGAFFGLGGGVVTALLPMSVLRPCCAAGAAAGMACCTMPGMCLAVGGLVGVVLAALVPFERRAWWRTAAGVALGMTSVAVLGCATLVAGEAFGLVGGMIAGLAVTTAARRVLGGRAFA